MEQLENLKSGGEGGEECILQPPTSDDAISRLVDYYVIKDFLLCKDWICSGSSHDPYSNTGRVTWYKTKNGKYDNGSYMSDQLSINIETRRLSFWYLSYEKSEAHVGWKSKYLEDMSYTEFINWWNGAYPEAEDK